MISLNFFPKIGGTRFVEFELNSFKQGIDFLLFALDNLSASESEGLSIAVRERSNEHFPTIHFQQVGERYFFQLYISDQASVPVEEGWHCLVDQKTDKLADELVSTIWDEPEGNFFKARFSDGVMFSKTLLVSRESLNRFLGQYTENFQQWYRQGNWVNLGII